MKNINDLRNELTKLYGEIKTGEVDVKKAKEMNNAAGKIINSVKAELEYAELRKEKPEIGFLKYPVEK